MSSSMTQKSRVVVFDLDDTLYKEQDYLKSAYREIALLVGAGPDAAEEVYEQMLRWWQNGDNVFRQLIDVYGLDMTVDELLTIYRSHVPTIRLDEPVKNLLGRLHQYAVLGVITDGRSLSQQRKVETLELLAYMDEQDILVSEETGYEKPSEEPYRHFMTCYPSRTYYYIGDNPSKDFEAPNRLGWTTVCLLNDGRHIHRQDFSLPQQMLPKYKVSQLVEIENIII